MPVRFTLRALPGPPAAIEKRGDPTALAREAAALARLAGVPWAPPLVVHEPGRLVTGRLPGAPRPPGDLGPADGRRLGALLAELHARERSAEGGLWWWDAPERTLAGYHAHRVADAEAAAAGTPAAGLAAAAPAPPAAPGGTDRPFRMLHGDLVATNIVWGPEGPALVDWEFWRMGDPAEDLAYLAAVNDLAPPVAAAVAEGYGDPAVAARAAAWEPVVAADAAAWYLAAGMRRAAARAVARARRAAGR